MPWTPCSAAAPRAAAAAAARAGSSSSSRRRPPPHQEKKLHSLLCMLRLVLGCRSPSYGEGSLPSSATPDLAPSSFEGVPWTRVTLCSLQCSQLTPLLLSPAAESYGVPPARPARRGAGPGAGPRERQGGQARAAPRLQEDLCHGRPKNRVCSVPPISQASAPWKLLRLTAHNYRLGRSGAAYLAIARWPGLLTLALEGCGLGDAGVAALTAASWPALRHDPSSI